MSDFHIVEQRIKNGDPFTVADVRRLRSSSGVMTCMSVVFADATYRFRQDAVWSSTYNDKDDAAINLSIAKKLKKYTDNQRLTWHC